MCPVCAGSDVAEFFALNDVPVQPNVQWPTEEAALRAPRGNLRLAFCRTCSHVFNREFDPAQLDYTESYENSLHFSAHFNSYARELAQRLIEKFQLRNKTVIEIGCGKGDFLALVCGPGGNRGYGFDKSYEPSRTEAPANITFIRDFFGAKYRHIAADFVCCRHVLEHIQKPTEYLCDLRAILPARCALYFEVPNSLYTLRDFGIWDLIYEHPSYFSAESLTTAFRQAGFSVLDVASAFGNQFLGIEANLNEGKGRKVDADAVKEIARDVAAFDSHCKAKIGEWQSRIAEMQSEAKRAVVWGAGSKGISFLNFLKIRDGFVVDQNPYKQGKYVAGTAQQIVAPSFLVEYRPHYVIVMNALYQEEIKYKIDQLSIEPELLFA
jgi:hypothetical protein